jgi:hypothetical protein
MDIQEAAIKLKLSVRHLRRLIATGAIPAKKIKRMVEVTAWDIPDEVAKAADDAIAELVTYENFGEWMIQKMKDTGLTIKDVSKRTRIAGITLLEIANSPGFPDAGIEEQIGNVLMRADIERRCKKLKDSKT